MSKISVCRIADSMMDFRNLASAQLEAYFYDLEALEDEYDDPLTSILFRWPPNLTDDHVILVAGHLVSNKIHFYRYLKLDKFKY